MTLNTETALGLVLSDILSYSLSGPQPGSPLPGEMHHGGECRSISIYNISIPPCPGGYRGGRAHRLHLPARDLHPRAARHPHHPHARGRQHRQPCTETVDSVWIMSMYCYLHPGDVPAGLAAALAADLSARRPAAAAARGAGAGAARDPRLAAGQVSCRPPLSRY